MSLQDFKDALALKAFGWTVTEAQEARKCIGCRKDIDTVPHDESEYRISGLCDECFDNAVSGKR